MVHLVVLAVLCNIISLVVNEETPGFRLFDSI